MVFPVLDIACQQLLMEDSTVFSIQWTTVPRELAAGISARDLLERYCAYIRKVTLSLIRPEISENRVEFRLAALGASLISFTGPVLSGGELGESALLAISGGLLVQREGGELAFQVEEAVEGVKFTIVLSGFSPLLLGGPKPPRIRKRFYSHTQALVHRIVTVRFLARLCRELAGGDVRFRVVEGRVREGEEI